MILTRREKEIGLVIYIIVYWASLGIIGADMYVPSVPLIAVLGIHLLFSGVLYCSLGMMYTLLKFSVLMFLYERKRRLKS